MRNGLAMPPSYTNVCHVARLDPYEFNTSEMSLVMVPRVKGLKTNP